MDADCNVFLTAAKSLMYLYVTSVCCVLEKGLIDVTFGNGHPREDRLGW